MPGTAASNLALTLGARGGVYLCGGIVPRFIDYFHSSPFCNRFENKGRFDAYLAAMSVFVVLNKYPGLPGAAMAPDEYLQLPNLKRRRHPDVKHDQGWLKLFRQPAGRPESK